jgi:uncharacterized Fe-S cluster-containing protein
MDCRKIQQVIYRFIYGESSTVELRRVKMHLDRCHHCEKERQMIADILDHLKDELADEPLPDGCRERMLEKIKQQSH